MLGSCAPNRYRIDPSVPGTGLMPVALAACHFSAMAMAAFSCGVNFGFWVEKYRSARLSPGAASPRTGIMLIIIAKAYVFIKFVLFVLFLFRPREVTHVDSKRVIAHLLFRSLWGCRNGVDGCLLYTSPSP